MMIKTMAASGAAIAAVLLWSPAAVAADDPDCVNFETPIIISDGYDPLHLDGDGDGIGCEGNPGDPVKTDLYADLRGDDELAETGGSIIDRHPLRAYGAAGAAIVVGAATIILVRRSTRSEGE